MQIQFQLINFVNLTRRKRVEHWLFLRNAPPDPNLKLFKVNRGAYVAAARSFRFVQVREEARP